MERAGWRPRAAGWFTLPVSDGRLGVVAIGTASKYSARGEAEATAYVGVRDETVEPIICQLCDVKDQGYKQRTTVAPIGYLMPSKRWRDWLVTPVTAAGVGEELAAAVVSCAVPFLRELGSDPSKLIDAAKNSIGVHQASGRCRVAVLLAMAGRVAEAQAWALESRDKAGDNDAAWATAERHWADSFLRWMASHAHGASRPTTLRDQTL